MTPISRYQNREGGGLTLGTTPVLLLNQLLESVNSQTASMASVAFLLRMKRCLVLVHWLERPADINP